MVRITIDVPDRPVVDSAEQVGLAAASDASQTPEVTSVPTSARLPVALLAALDESARTNGLTRTAEIIWRLEHSMATVELARHFVVTEKRAVHVPAVSVPATPGTSDASDEAHP